MASSLRVIVLAVLLGNYGISEAQTISSPVDSKFRVDTSLILVPVTVTDLRGGNISGLDRNSFAILDNGKPEPITVFYAEDSPCSVGIVLDVSGSVKSTLNLEKAGVQAFLRSAYPEDDFFLVTVSSNPGVLAGRVGDAREIENLARSVTAGGSTALYDTIGFALDHARSLHKHRRALLVISDGMDNHSRFSQGALMDTLAESDTQVYTIAIGGVRRNVKGAEAAEIQHGLMFMDDLARKSGGLSVRLGEFENPSGAVTRIWNAIRNQYVIGYPGSDAGQPGKWHRIQVKVNLSKANVYARSGYQAR